MSATAWILVVLLGLVVAVSSAWTTERDIRFIWRFAHTLTLYMLSILLAVNVVLLSFGLKLATLGNIVLDGVLMLLLIGFARVGPKK